VHAAASTLNITNSTISGNSAQFGGGVGGFYIDGRITNSTISGNTASQGGALDNNGADCNSSLVVINSTISGNTANRGGGISNSCNIRLARTLVSGNAAQFGAEVSAGLGLFAAGNFNLFGHSGLTNAQAFDDFIPGATDITATSNGNRPTALAGILNTTLAHNGGPTRTHALVAGSPAVDAVTNVNTCPPPARDQRGVTRPQDGNNDGGLACDTGSFERR
jgi:hypothetical protein